MVVNTDGMTDKQKDLYAKIDCKRKRVKPTLVAALPARDVLRKANQFANGGKLDGVDSNGKSDLISKKQSDDEELSAKEKQADRPPTAEEEKEAQEQAVHSKH